ncbi:MAG: SCO family protein [Verrucomicrobiales bacterium]|nr:SCO family protein [Verrucomicrobiales bacterium]
MDAPATTPHPPPARHKTVIWFCVIIMVLGLVIFWNYLIKMKRDGAAMQDRPPYAGELRNNLEATEMSGKSVSLDQLDGKVWVAGFLYTLCPRGCAGLAMQMHDLQKKFSGEPRFQLVSVSLNAEWDTPERLRAWTKEQGFSGDNWWFLTGNGETLRGYMKDQFHLFLSEVPPEKRTNEFDKYDHKLALVLVDHKRRIRGTYDFSSPDLWDLWQEKLEKDIKTVLVEAAQEK